MKDTDATRKVSKAATNLDPIMGTPRAHPIRMSLGATGGAMAGAAIGAIAGSVSAVVGLVASAVAGGLAGKGAADKMDPSVYDQHPKTEHSMRPSAEHGASYVTHRPAYRAGYEGYTPFTGKKYEDVGSHLR
jgi:hypothetical protein